MNSIFVYCQIFLIFGWALPSMAFVLRQHPPSYSRLVASPWNYEIKTLVFRRPLWIPSLMNRVSRAVADNKKAYRTCGRLLTNRADKLCKMKLTATSTRTETNISAMCCQAECTDADIIAGNYWNIYNLPKYFDVSTQPRMTRSEFHECIDIAFARLPEVIRNAANFVYLDKNLETATDELSSAYANHVNQMVGDYFFTCDSIWLADQMEDAPGKVFIYYFETYFTVV